MISGFMLMVLASAIFWVSETFPVYIISVSIGIGGFFLASSKMLVIYDSRCCHIIWLVVISVLFLFLIGSFIPLNCSRTFTGQEWVVSCQNLWSSLIHV